MGKICRFIYFALLRLLFSPLLIIIFICMPRKFEELVAVLYEDEEDDD